MNKIKSKIDMNKGKETVTSNQATEKHVVFKIKM